MGGKEWDNIKDKELKTKIRKPSKIPFRELSFTN